MDKEKMMKEEISLLCIKCNKSGSSTRPDLVKKGWYWNELILKTGVNVQVALCPICKKDKTIDLKKRTKEVIDQLNKEAGYEE